jgi:hypothetical protein
MWTYQSAMIFWAVLAALPLMTSVIYFRVSPAEAPLANRIGVSVHGLFIALLHLGAVYIAAARLHGDHYGLPFLFLCVLGAALIGYSFWSFRGNKHTHWLQAINISWLLGLFLLGGMAVTGRWQ